MQNTTGGVKLDVVLPNFDAEVDGFGPEVHIVLSRGACKRAHRVFAKASDSAAGELAPGTPAATAFTRELNDLLAREGNALFWDCALDDSVGVAVGPALAPGGVRRGRPGVARARGSSAALPGLRQSFVGVHLPCASLTTDFQ